MLNLKSISKLKMDKTKSASSLNIRSGLRVILIKTNICIPFNCFLANHDNTNF